MKMDQHPADRSISFHRDRSLQIRVLISLAPVRLAYAWPDRPVEAREVGRTLGAEAGALFLPGLILARMWPGSDAAASVRAVEAGCDTPLPISETPVTPLGIGRSPR